MSIAWDDALKVGNIEIDADHKELIGLVGDFETMVKSPKSVTPRSIQITLERLQLYAHDHFAREEYIQAIAKYPGLAENKRQHDALRKTLADYIAKFEAGQFGDLGKAADEMAAFLNHWLMSHIVDVDMKMRGALSDEGWR
ncbi:hemerythrin [Paramagnetospirillum kuznetsovii]|uniref:Hemerythrin n=1 Tax=Paramagnetospirillum kuznetsovii TaxID=2053833 RepID=A0A364NXH9_9PROT|nr:bacteriohemerythrin [Paramagnetospirillum kuznetsovii]RAU21605.1 hemerythrin [Paramagnetospirillum kuznetsovii]